MFAPLRQETDQPPRDGLDIARLIAVEDPQFSARIRGPRVIEIQHERNLSLIAPLRLIYGFIQNPQKGEDPSNFIFSIGTTF